MAGKRKTVKGRFLPTAPIKYAGNPYRIVYRSSWERDFMTWLDTNSGVLLWASEEIAVPYVIPGDKKMHNYFPDFLIKYQPADKSLEPVTELIEIKPAAETKPPKIPANMDDPKAVARYSDAVYTYAKNMAKWAAAASWCADRGIEFRVLTEKELYRGKQNSTDSINA